ncbi:MAG: hypothetical protein R3C58_03195 [Parvularculaceae bacterium]
MTQENKNRLMLAVTIALFAVTALLLARNEELIFRDSPEVEVMRDPGDPDTIVFIWRSEIEAPMARRFAEAYGEWRNEGRRILIDMHSPGGSVKEGDDVIAVINEMKRTHAVDTRVRARHSCFSMCVPVFLQGERRIAGADAVFMFHEPSAVDMATGKRVTEPAFERERATRRFFERYFVASPMDAAWRDRLAVEWKGRDLFYTARDLVKQNANVVTEIE